MEEKKTKSQTLPGITFTGNITVKGDMFNIHDNEHVHVNINKQPEQIVEDNEYVDLVFFDNKHFGTMERQNKLRCVLKKVLPRMDADNGRDWIAVYIAYHYFMNREFIMKGYADFFADIEGLLPGILTKVNKDYDKGDKRYKTYTELLASETTKWFILSECLPPFNEWRSKKYNYAVDDNRKNRIQDIVRDIYTEMKNI